MRGMGVDVGTAALLLWGLRDDRMDGEAAVAEPVRLKIVESAVVTPAVVGAVKLLRCGRSARRELGRGEKANEDCEGFWTPNTGLGGSTLEASASGVMYGEGVIASFAASSTTPLASCCSNKVPLLLPLGVLAVEKFPSGREAPVVIAPPGRGVAAAAAVAAAPPALSRAAVAAATAAAAAALAPWDSTGPMGRVSGRVTAPWVSGRPVGRDSSGVLRPVFASRAACSGKSESSRGFGTMMVGMIALEGMIRCATSERWRATSAAESWGLAVACGALGTGKVAGAGFGVLLLDGRVGLG